MSRGMWEGGGRGEGGGGGGGGVGDGIDRLVKGGGTEHTAAS